MREIGQMNKNSNDVTSARSLPEPRFQRSEVRVALVGAQRADQRSPLRAGRLLTQLPGLKDVSVRKHARRRSCSTCSRPGRFADAMFADGQLKDGNHVIRAKGQLSQWVLFSLGSPRIAARAS